MPLGCSDHPRHAYTPKLRAAAGRSPLLCIVCHGVPALTAAGRWLKAPALLVRSSPGLPSQLLIRLRIDRLDLTAPPHCMEQQHICADSWLEIG